MEIRTFFKYIVRVVWDIESFPEDAVRTCLRRGRDAVIKGANTMANTVLNGSASYSFKDILISATFDITNLSLSKNKLRF